MITEGLIAIGIIALIAALFLLGGRAKTRQTSQHVKHKRAANKHSVALAEPSGSAKTVTPFPVTRAPFPISTADKQYSTFEEPSRLAKAMVSPPVPQASFPLSTTDQLPLTLVESPQATEETLTQFDLYAPEDDAQELVESPQATEETPTQFDLYAPEDDAQELVESSQVTKEALASSSMQTTTVAHTPVQEIRPIHTQVQQVVLDQAQVPVALNEQPTAKLHHDQPEAQTQSSLASKAVPLPPTKPLLRSLRRPPSIDEQMADLTTDICALQQQAAEIARRLSYLSASLEHSLAPVPCQEPHA